MIPSAPLGQMSNEFLHTALIVDSDQTLRERLIPALRRSLAAGEPVLMVVSPHTEQVVRAALGEQATRLEWGDPQAFYQRLGFAFETFRRYLAEQHAIGRRVHIVAEPDIRTDPTAAAPIDRVGAYLSYEAMCNDAYASYGCPVTCLWDTRHHPTLVIEGVRSLHNHELDATGPTPNPGYIPPADYLAGRNQIALEPPFPTADLDVTLHATDSLALLRDRVQAWARGHGFTAAAAADVVLATSEIATNGLEHGAPPARVRCWQHADTLVVQVDDAGAKPLPPMGGYQRPGMQPEGRGLWLARQLADSVTTYTDATHTAVRLHFPSDITHRNLPTE